MLPPEHRMRRSTEFSRTVRQGTRVGRSTLVVHLIPRPDRETAVVGFVVPRAVGGAVIRNKVKRRLRAIVGTQIAEFSASDIVVRALPRAADADFGRLESDLAGAVRTAQRRVVNVSSHE